MEALDPFASVMCFSGHDPTGGAGIQADIEACISMGAHPCTVVTCVTAQDTTDVKNVVPMSLASIVEQARAVLEDIPISAFKIGLIANAEGVEAIHTLLQDYRHVPVVLDPVMYSGGGTPLADEELKDAMKELLIPYATLILPNTHEARELAHEADTIEACAHEIMDMGAEYVLITGTHDNSPKVVNRLFGNKRLLESFEWERLPEVYHGSGCTLASACAALMAQGLDPVSTVHEAQEYTWNSLKMANRLGMGQFIPDRLFWAHEDEHD